MLLGSEEDMREYLSVLSRSEGRGMCIRGALGIVGGGNDAVYVDEDETFWWSLKGLWERSAGLPAPTFSFFFFWFGVE